MSRPKLLILSLLVGFFALSLAIPATSQVLRQSPHADIKIACDVCHNPDGWTVKPSDVKFDHAATAFPLEGRHKGVSCRECHSTLTFKEAVNECASCHQEPHSGQFGAQCAVCHSPDGWENRSQMTARHAVTRFPLAGAHRAVDCLSCHAGGRYVNTPTECVGCHLPEYNGTSSPSHVQAGFSGNCTSCHALDKGTWQGASFTHPAAFSLTGGHASRTCTECHANGYANTSTACFSCHANTFNATANPNHAASNFSHSCEQCHTISGWQPAQFDHNLARFPLTGGHLAVDCASCHIGGRYTGTSQECYGCHQATYQGVNDPNHVSGNYDHNCTACHSTAGWQPASINHEQTHFPLVGAHRAVDCASCHTAGYNNTSTVCFDCHRTAFETVPDPSHVAGSYNHDCTTCHTMDGWQPARIDHNQTRFPLNGAHLTASCESCHTTRFNGTPLDCYTCHTQDFADVQQPNHVQSQFDHDCLKCHSTAAWQPATFDHQQSAFPLTGAHRTTDCAQCHVNGQFTGTATDCFTCHRADFEQVESPSHAQGQFDHNCTACHTTDAWKPSTFNHQATDFPLTGAHRAADCASCHSTGQFNGLASDCWSCHQVNFEGTDNPNHTTRNFTHDCQICHSTNGWAPAKVDHNQTNFPLTGRHRLARCEECHQFQRYTGTSTECFACHNPEYADSENPNHLLSNFDRNCATCHTTSGWTPAAYDHAQARFPLTGAHRQVACLSCHVGGRFTGTATDCYTCHTADYQAVADPSHTAAQFDHNCTVCHSTDGWKPATFNHDQSNYPLTGAHRTVDCASCHINGRFDGTPTDCWSCHQQTFTDVPDPNHVQGQFDHNCTTCHSTDGWKPATFNHDQSDYPLTGAHRTVDCASCHVGGRFDGTPTDCWSCHQQTYTDVADPSHVQGQYDHNCTICHTTTAWQPAQFDHSNGPFPLTGAHRQVECASCHVNGRFGGTPSDCYTCHTNDFNNVGNPNHRNAQFPHDCTVCHTTNNWDSNFNQQHDQQWFPVYSGEHRGEWATCADCHSNPNNYQVFECITCHEHNDRNEVDRDHREVRDYAYNSAACYRCHPDGRGDDMGHPIQPK